MHWRVLILLLDLLRTGEDDHDPEVGSFHDLMTFGATFVLKTSLYLLQKVVKTIGVLILLLKLSRTGEDDHDPEVGSSHDLMTFGATFVFKTLL